MKTHETHPYVVLGATGRQGGAVTDALLGREVPVRAVVRDPRTTRAVALAERGVEIAVADQEDSVALTRAFEGAAGVFAVTTFSGPDGPEGEVRRGSLIADAIEAADTPHVVFSSVGGAERDTGIPHFESKRRTEERLRGHRSLRVVRPVFFMENLLGMVAAADSGEDVLQFPLRGDVPVQMVATRDIGRAAARLLVEPNAVDRTAIEIAGDELTLEQVTFQIGRHVGRALRYSALSLDILGDDEDARRMFEWFARPPAYQASIVETERLIPGVLDVPGWLAQL